MDNIFYSDVAYITVQGAGCFYFDEFWDNPEGVLWYYYHPYFNFKVIDKRPAVKQFIKDMNDGKVSPNDFCSLFYDEKLISYKRNSINYLINDENGFTQDLVEIIIDDFDGEYIPTEAEHTDILYFYHIENRSVPNYFCKWESVHFVNSDYYSNALNEKSKNILESEANNFCFLGHLIYDNVKLEEHRKDN